MDGDFGFAFCHRLRNCSALEAEFWGVFHGLSIATAKGYNSIIVETDSSLVVEALNAFNTSNHPFQNLINEIKSLAAANFSTEWRKIDRCANNVADMLAKNCSQFDLDCNIFDTPPLSLIQTLNSDRIGLDGCGL